MKKENFVRICPKCGSINLIVDYPNITTPMMIGSKCQDCGYSGVCPEVEISNIKEFKKKSIKNRLFLV